MNRVGRAILLKLGRKRLRPVLLGGILVLTVMQIVLFSPGSVEEGDNSPAPLDPKTFLPDSSGNVAPDVPKNRVPDYTVEGYNHVSTQGGVRQWKLLAERAYLFNDLKLVHSRTVTAQLFDPDGQITVVTGRESKYFMNHRDLEIFGNVRAVFPDGFELRSDYLKYRPAERKIEIPPTYFVTGGGAPDSDKGGQRIEFEGYGLDFAMAKSRIVLEKAAKVSMIGQGGDRTDIRSDRATILRDRKTAHFTMERFRPLQSRFVEITQPTLHARSRTAELNYGDSSQMVHYLVAKEDVLIRELAKDAPLKYATGGKASFDANRNQVVLTEFPQVYQDHDTVTGEVIILHRDTDIVEVEHSNAFSQGSRAD